MIKIPPSKRRSTLVVNRDVWYEILFLVEPSFIFNCIRVSKTWFEIITSPEFRQGYQKRWRSDSKLVGFAKNKENFQLLATSKLGRIMNANKSTQSRDCFISKSGAGDGLVLFGILPDVLFVSAPDSGPIQLPETPPDCGHSAATAILSQPDASYKVILITGRNSVRMNIHTFSPSTAKWESSVLTADPSFNRSIRGPGIVNSSRNLVYWRGDRFGKWVAEYDDNTGRISQIAGPYFQYEEYHDVNYNKFNYGLSPQGYLRCAVTSGNSIDIVGLDDDDDDDNKVWTKLHCVGVQQISFLSFSPGRSDCIYVKLGEKLHLYNLQTQEFKVCDVRRQPLTCDMIRYVDLVPLTMADLGVWPSSPFLNSMEKIDIDVVDHSDPLTMADLGVRPYSPGVLSNSAKPNIGIIKQMLGYDREGNVLGSRIGQK